MSFANPRVILIGAVIIAGVLCWWLGLFHF
jgi:hypothetical protein